MTDRDYNFKSWYKLPFLMYNACEVSACLLFHGQLLISANGVKIKDAQAYVINALSKIAVGETVYKNQFAERFGQEAAQKLEELKATGINRVDEGSFAVTLAEDYVKSNERGELRVKKDFAFKTDLTNPNPLDVTEIKGISVFSKEYGVTARIMSLNLNYIDEAGNLDLGVHADVDGYGETDQSVKLDPYGKERNAA